MQLWQGERRPNTWPVKVLKRLIWEEENSDMLFLRRCGQGRGANELEEEDLMPCKRAASMRKTDCVSNYFCIPSWPLSAGQDFWWKKLIKKFNFFFLLRKLCAGACWQVEFRTLINCFQVISCVNPAKKSKTKKISWWPTGLEVQKLMRCFWSKPFLTASPLLLLHVGTCCKEGQRGLWHTTAAPVS